MLATLIFSTSAPSVGDLDEALIRPGRCFARLHARAILAFAGETKKRSLAQVYRALG